MSEWGDVYPLTKSSIEDQLTPDSISSGLTLSLPQLRDEYGLFPFAAFREQRLVLLRRINEAAAQPQVRRTPRPLPVLSVATKEQKEEFLWLLASVDTPLSALLSSAPHGVKGALLLDEMWTRGVSLTRAAWFIRVVYRNSVPDNARVRVSSQQRSRLWTDEVRRYVEQLVHDVTAAVRPAAARQQQGAGPTPFTQLLDKFHYVVALLALSYSDGWMARVKWLDGLVDQFLALATALLSLPSTYPPSTASSTLQALASSFILWQHKATLLFLLLSPFQPSLQQSAYHSFRLVHCLDLIRHKLRGMASANDEARLSRERALRRCEAAIDELTGAAVGSDLWKRLLSGAAQPTNAHEDRKEGGTLSAAELLLKLEEWVGKGGAGADDLVSCLNAAIVADTRQSYQPLHVVLEWCTHPHVVHHTDSVAAVFTLVCNLTTYQAAAPSTTTTVAAAQECVTPEDDATAAQAYSPFHSPAALHGSSLRPYIAASLHSFLLRFPSLPAFSSAVCRHRLLCLLSHLVLVGLFDYTQYVHYVLRMELVSSSSPASALSHFSVDSLCFLPSPTASSSSSAELRRVALYGLSSVKREEAALYWHSLCVLLQRAPVMSGANPRDVWQDKRRECAGRLTRLHVSLIRRLRGLHSSVAEAIDTSASMLAPASLQAFLSALPFHVSLKLLSGLVDDALSFLHASPATPSSTAVYLERVLRYLLFLIESSPHFPLLLSTLLRLLSLSSDHRLCVEEAVFSALRRHWSLLCCTGHSSALYDALVLYLRTFEESSSADACVERCGLPLSFTAAVRAESSAERQTTSVTVTSPYAALLARATQPKLSGAGVVELLERYRMRQTDLPAIATVIRQLGPVTASTLQAVQREVVRHILLLALSPSATNANPELPSHSLYTALPHLQPSAVKLRLGDFCLMLRTMADCHAESGGERTDAATLLLNTLVLAADLSDQLGASGSGGQLSAASLLGQWRLQDAVPDGTTGWRLDMSDAIADCLSLFVAMAINRRCLSLGRYLAHVTAKLLSQHGSVCLRRVTGLLFAQRHHRVQLWECDRQWLEDTIRVDGQHVFRFLRECVSAQASSASEDAARTGEELLRCLVSCRAVQQLCAQHMPTFYQQLQLIPDEQRRRAIFDHIDGAVRLLAEQPPSELTDEAGCGGMEGVSEAMAQELVRQNNSRRLLKDARTATAGSQQPFLFNAIVEPPSMFDLLSSISPFSLPSLHIRLQLLLDVPSPSFSDNKRLLTVALLHTAALATQSQAPALSTKSVSSDLNPSTDEASALLRLLCWTDAAVRQQVAASLTSQLAGLTRDFISMVSAIQPASDNDDVGALLSQLIHSEADMEQSGPSQFPSQAASLLTALYGGATFTSEQVSAFVHGVVQQLSSIAAACNDHSAALLSTYVSTSCVTTLDTLRRLLIPLLPHLSKPGNAAVLDELLRSCLSLLVFPLSSLSVSPDEQPFSSFLHFSSRVAAQLHWAEAIQASMPNSAPTSSLAGNSPATAVGGGARAESVLFALHTALLASSRQRPIAPLLVDRILQSIASSQGGAVADELHFVLPPSLSPAVSASSAAATAVAAAVAARQPIDPWCVLEGCGGGPLLDAVWDSSQALPRG